MHQHFCVEPVQRLAEPLRRFPHMQAAGDPTAQGRGEPRHRMARRTAAQKSDHLARRRTVVGKALREFQGLIERVDAGDAIPLVSEQFITPAPLRRTDEQVA